MELAAKLKFYFTFFKSTLLFSIGIGLAVNFVSLSFFNPNETISSVPILFILGSTLRSCCLLGYPFSLLYKELSKKNEYYFYQNIGISKISLIGFTFGLYILFSILIYTLSYIVWNIMF